MSHPAFWIGILLPITGRRFVLLREPEYPVGLVQARTNNRKVLPCTPGVISGSLDFEGSRDPGRGERHEGRGHRADGCKIVGGMHKTDEYA